MTTQLHADPQTFNWLLANFVRNTDSVRDTIAVSSDGLLIAHSDGLGRADADQLAAIISGLVALARSAARKYGFDGLRLMMVEMRGGFLLVSAIGDGSSIGVLADGAADLGLLGHEMAILAVRAGDLLSPTLITQLRQGLPR